MIEISEFGKKTQYLANTDIPGFHTIVFVRGKSLKGCGALNPGLRHTRECVHTAVAILDSHDLNELSASG